MRFDAASLDIPPAGGGVLFGIGWGMARLCSGTDIADLSLAPRNAAIFMLAMRAGMPAFKLTTSRRGPVNGTKPHRAPKGG
jgi:uncharacterized membrane protein YedE/YeeE